MVDINKSIKCINCGFESNISLSSGLGITEVSFNGKCPQCGNSIQMNYGIIESSVKSGDTATDDSVSLDENMFEPAVPSDEIRDIIES